MEDFLSIYLSIYLLAYLALAFVIPTYNTWEQTGVNPITFGKADTAHNYICFVMKSFIALLFAAVLCFSIGGNTYTWPSALCCSYKGFPGNIHACRIQPLILSHSHYINNIFVGELYLSDWRGINGLTGIQVGIRKTSPLTDND